MNLRAGSFRDLFWQSESIIMALRFLVIWEVYRHTFPKGIAWTGSASKGFLIAGAGFLIMPIVIFWSFESYNTSFSFYLALERGFGYAQAVLVLAILFAARYCGIELGRNLWGIAVAFGTQLSISTANDAMIDLRHSYLPYWQILSPVAFIAMLSVWIWAVWVYAPNPPIAMVTTADQIPELGLWEENWNRTISTVRRIGRP